MKTIIINKIGMLIGALISLLRLEPLQAIGVVLIINLGYWCRYISEALELFGRATCIKPLLYAAF